MSNENSAPESVNNADPVSAEELASQVDALLGEAADPAEAPADALAPEAPTASEAPAAPEVNAAYPPPPEGYVLRYVQTPQGYQAMYVPAQQAAYAQATPWSIPSQPRQEPAQRQRSFGGPMRSPARPAGALKERPRKKPWGKVIGACVLSVAVVALVVWAVVAGASALIRSFGGDRSRPSMGGDQGGQWGSDYGDSFIVDDNGNLIPNGSLPFNAFMYIVDENGNLILNGGFSFDENGYIVDENGTIIFDSNSDSPGYMIHANGDIVDENGNIVGHISDFGSLSGEDQYHTVHPENSLYFVHADGGLNVRETPDGERLATVPNGFPVYVYAFQGNWAYISYGDMSGWVNANYISLEPLNDPKLYYVHADGGLNIRAEPTTASARVENIPNGTQIYSLARYENWVFTFYGGTYGWVSADYLSTSAYRPRPTQGSTPGQGYTMADIEAAIADAKAYYRSRKGKTPNGGRQGDSLTDAQVEELYWDAVSLVVGMENFPAGQFQNMDGMLDISDGYGFFYQVSDPKIKSMEDWADMFYSVLTDDLAYDILCGAPMFMLDGKMYISGAAMGDEGLGTDYTIRVETESSGYKLIMDVVNTREDYYTGTVERMEWTFTAHCFKEDGVWVFDDADTPYR